MFKIKRLSILVFLVGTKMCIAQNYYMDKVSIPPQVIGFKKSKKNGIINPRIIAIPTYKDNSDFDINFQGYDKENNIFNVQYFKDGMISYGIRTVDPNNYFDDIQIKYEDLFFQKLDNTAKLTVGNGSIVKDGSNGHVSFLVKAHYLTPGKWRVLIRVKGYENDFWGINDNREGDLDFTINVIECPSFSISNTPVCNADPLVTTITATPINSPNYKLFNYYWYENTPLSISDNYLIKSHTDRLNPSFEYKGQGISMKSSESSKPIILIMKCKQFNFECTQDYKIQIKPLPPDPKVTPITGCGFTTFTKKYSSDKNDYYYGISPEVAKLGVNKLPDDAFGLKYTEEKDIYFMSKSPNGCWNQIELRFPKDELGTKPSKPVVANLTPCQCELNAATFVGTVPYGATTLSWSGLADQMDQEGSTYAVPRELGVYTVRSVLKHPSNPQADCYSDPLTIYVDPIPCINCTSDFSPIPGETYVLSAWVKEISDKRTPLTYSFPYIDITYENTSATSGPFFAKGPIIEGWQKIETEVEIPSGASMFYLHLKSLPSKNDFPVSVYFDDIRIHPLKANMTSYVYDPITLKLVAELDANNFATFYSHDAEGNLISMKKETIDGIKTIKEGKKVPFRKNEENIRESTEPISITEPNSLYE